MSSAIIFLTCSDVIVLFSHTMSFLGVMMASTSRSPSKNTLSTMSCSTGCTSPSSVPSFTIDFISSSVTLDSLLLSPNTRNRNAVLPESSHTNGDAIRESIYIGRATTFATFSAMHRPIRFGRSSPNISVRYVTRMTIKVCATAGA